MQNPKRIIITTGYMGSGSSAVTDIMKETEGVAVSDGDFEYVFLHCPNGIFDLEDKLLIGNNSVRSDEAIYSFESAMKQLYEKDNWWCKYKKKFGEGFWKATEDYIKEIVEVESNHFWYFQEDPDIKMILRLYKNRILELLSLNRIKPKTVLKYSPMRLSFITPERFYTATKEYIYRLINMMGYSKQSIMLDQLLLPHNLFRFDNYFSDDAFVFVVERDPRDVFISNKYYWSTRGGAVSYPVDVEDFCSYYKKMRAIEKPYSSNRIVRMSFEDLVYRYDETVGFIFDKLGWDRTTHVRPKTAFIPEKSINNTQLFLTEDRFKEESDYIARELSEYIYDFPYPITHSKERVF